MKLLVMEVKTYDSRPDTIEHIAEVRRRIHEVVSNLNLRSDVHDKSKLSDPERPGFDEWTPKLRGLTYGSPEYAGALASLKPYLDHHYAENSHHPEHYPDGIAGMSLFDLIEMFCDWKAATMRHDDGDMTRSLQINATRFKMSEQMAAVFRNTLAETGW